MHIFRFRNKIVVQTNPFRDFQMQGEKSEGMSGIKYFTIKHYELSLLQMYWLSLYIIKVQYVLKWWKQHVTWKMFVTLLKKEFLAEIIFLLFAIFSVFRIYQQ